MLRTLWSSCWQMTMYTFFRARLRQRRRLRAFLVQSQFHLFNLWKKVVSICPCFSVSEAHAVALPSIETRNSSPVAQPIYSLDELRGRTLLLSPLAEYLKSSVPLKMRLLSSARPRLLVCHDYKGGYQEDKWVQGKEGKEGYVLWQWHLIDVFVYFSHSLVTIPPPGWINAAHKHGVPVLGTFITEWAEGASVCRSLLATEESCCMFASRLAELAHELGFDGWLINIENTIDVENIPRLHLFVQNLRQCMHSRSAGSFVIWYDAVTEKGELHWQDCLNEENRFFFDDSDGLFTNYTWSEEKPKSSADAAGDRATDVFMGVDVFGRNTFGGGKFDCDIALKVARKAQVSAALFAPGWVYETQQPPSFEIASTRWWRRIEDCWPIAGCSPTELPFFTDFSRGCGTRVSVEGNEVSTQPWFNLSCQSLQPILKVISQPQSSLEVDMSYEAAYSGGSCLRISGSGDTLGLVQLYESSISVKDTRLHVSYSVQADDELHICLALLVSRENSKQLVLLMEESAAAEVPQPSPNCVINRSTAKPRGSSRWKLLEHELDPDDFHIHQIYAVAYSCHFDVQKLISLFESSSWPPFNTTATNELQISHALLGHVRIAAGPEHDAAELPQIVFEGCEPEWIRDCSEDWTSVSLTLRWGLVQREVHTTSGCQWVQYSVFVTKDEEGEGAGDRRLEYVGVAVVQAFSVQDFMVPSSCNMVRFYVRAQCACGLLGEFSQACDVDVSRARGGSWRSESQSSQPLMADV